MTKKQFTHDPVNADFTIHNEEEAKAALKQIKMRIDACRVYLNTHGGESKWPLQFKALKEIEERLKENMKGQIDDSSLPQ